MVHAAETLFRERWGYLSAITGLDLGPAANALFTELPGVVAQADVPNVPAYAQNRQVQPQQAQNGQGVNLNGEAIRAIPSSPCNAVVGRWLGATVASTASRSAISCARRSRLDLRSGPPLAERVRRVLHEWWMRRRPPHLDAARAHDHLVHRERVRHRPHRLARLLQRDRADRALPRRAARGARRLRDGRRRADDAVEDPARAPLEDEPVQLGDASAIRSAPRV